ncbi:MAG: hypothetical protein IT350_18420, partial [Deltaproteobacteria bacterium]|nr:hypothetical protein [Deltaproteobacteria bacterium]
MRRFNRIGVPLAIFVIALGYGAGSALATPCTFEAPPATLGELFSECEEMAGCEGFRFESMTTDSGCSVIDDYVGDDDDEIDDPYHIRDDHFEIDQIGVFRLGLDFLPTADSTRGYKHFASNGNSTTPGVDDWGEYCVGKIRFTRLIGNPSQLGPPLVDGTVFGYFATERPVDSEGHPLDCVKDELETLARPGVLYLPGFRNPSSPAEAAKLAALWSTSSYQPLVGSPAHLENAGKVFVVMIAPPSHVAADMSQDIDPSDLPAYEDFNTIVTQINVSAGREPSGPGWRALEDAQHRYLLDGFLGEDPVQPARNYAWAFGESAMRAVNLFDKFFEPAGWTSGSLAIGGFSAGGWLGLVSNEALQASMYSNVTITGVFTFAAHGSLDDNFRVPGNNMGYTIVTSGAPLVGDDAANRPYIAWDCDGDLPSQFSQPVLDRMEAGCALSRYFSPLRYDPTFDERPILLAQGSADEPWGLMGLQRTFEMYRSYLGAENAFMQLEGDVDHGYFLGARGGYGFLYGDYFWHNALFPSEGVIDAGYVDLDDPQTFDRHLDKKFESFVNADALHPRRLTQGWNRLEGSIRNFILSSAGSGIESEEIVPPPPSPIRPSDSSPGVDIAMSSYTEDGDKIYRYEMTACYDEDLPNVTGYENAEFEIRFIASPDRFWHTLPACDDEEFADPNPPDATYVVDAENGNYEYERNCVRKVAGHPKYNDRCGTVDGDDSDVSLTRNGFRGEPVAQNPEGLLCSTYAIEFRGSIAGMNPWAPPKQFAAWAELVVQDENDTQLASSTSPIGIKTLSSLGETDEFTQCVRSMDDSGLFGSAVTLMVDFGFAEMPFSFSNTPSCNGTPIVLDEWPEPVEDLEVLDFSGYNVELDGSAFLATGERGLTITTDCDFTIPSSSTLAVDADDSDAQLTIIARNITIDGLLYNRPEESAMIRLAALDSLNVGALGEVSIRNLDRDGSTKGGIIYLSSNGSVEVHGELNATQDVAGGQIIVEGHDVTYGRYAEIHANAATGNPSTGGVIATWSTGDVLVDWESNDPSQTAIFTATGDTQDGSIDFTGCSVDEDDGTYDPTPSAAGGNCPLTDILDLESVDWCDGYEDNDLCCQVGDPCGYGYDGVCQCADSCEWDVMDCTGAPVGVQVSPLDDSEMPVVG